MLTRYDQPQTDLLLPSARTNGSLQTSGAAPETYYGLPMIKPPTWKWPIPGYFWLGGVAGGAALVGAAADLFGGERHRATVRHARWLTFALGAICPIPLIQDLGRPLRFFRMLRVFKVTSPLNVGTWILSAFGGVSAILAVKQAAEDDIFVRRESGLGRFLRAVPSAPFSLLHGLLGLALGSYTGVVLTGSVVPIWASAGVLLGPLFISTAVASGAAALVLVGILTGQETQESREEVDAIEAASEVAQLGIVLAREMLVPERIAKPLREGMWGLVYRIGAIGGGMVAPLGTRLVMRLAGQRMGRALTATTATLSLIGALAERFAITEAGKQSALDPLAYHELTKGAPGESRPTPAQQAHMAPKTERHHKGISASDYLGT